MEYDEHPYQIRWNVIILVAAIVIGVIALTGWLQYEFGGMVALLGFILTTSIVVYLIGNYVGEKNAERRILAGAKISQDASESAMYALAENLGNMAKLTSHVVKPHAEGAKNERLRTQYDGNIRVLNHKAELRQLELDDKEKRHEANEERRSLRIEAKNAPTWNDMFADEEQDQGQDQDQGDYTYQSDTPTSNVRYYD